jgi:NCAIR mutase (PurE)-related protein
LGSPIELQGFAELDFAREKRCGFPEVVYGAGKTPEQVASIMQALVEQHGVVLCTRACAEQAAAVRVALPDAQFFSSCRMLFVDRRAETVRVTSEAVDELFGGSVASRATETQGGASTGTHADTDASTSGTASTGTDGGGAGFVVVCCAGTSDLPVAQEAALTARLMGSKVRLLTDVGISGVHRVLAHADTLRDAHVIIAVAGMEGALPSLVAGLVDVPVVAVPTSVGYGASFGGIAALLGMLNSCAGGVSVVNIDNGFGAGVIAHRTNLPPARFARHEVRDELRHEDAARPAVCCESGGYRRRVD